MAKIEMGKNYTTRDGRVVRVLCVDGPGDRYPVIGLIEGETEVDTWTDEGRYYYDRDETCGKDLVLAGAVSVHYFGLSAKHGVLGAVPAATPGKVVGCQYEQTLALAGFPFILKVTWAGEEPIKAEIEERGNA